MAEHQLTCRACGVQLPKGSHLHRRYCDHRCAREAEAKRRHEAQPLCDCINCGQPFKPKAKDRTKFCGRKCGLEWTGFQAGLRRTGGRVWVRVKRRKPKAEAKTYYAPVLDALCRHCGACFNRLSDGSTRFMCSQACANSAAAKAKRASRKKRKALERGARIGEIIDPIAVFERDGWRCGVCGAKTHKAKRGTIHPRAPELDHIVALARGGTHTWGNVQCACRACNGAKGAASYGQLHLFPAA